MIRRIDEDDDDFGEDFSDLEEPELVHLNARAQGISDTEADFLDSGGTSLEPSADRNRDLDNITEELKPAPIMATATTTTMKLATTATKSAILDLGAAPASGPKQVVETKEVSSSSSVSNVDRNIQEENNSSSHTSRSSRTSSSSFTNFSNVPQDRIDLISKQKSSSRSSQSPPPLSQPQPQQQQQQQQKFKKQKSSVSQLIAKFESAENVNQPADSEKAPTPKTSTSSAKTPLRSTRSVTPEKVNKQGSVSPRPKSAVEPAILEIEEPSQIVAETLEALIKEANNADEADKKKNENDSSPIDITEVVDEREDLPLGAEALTEEALEEMTRRNGYTSYVLIGAAPNDDTASIHSSGSVGSANRVVVNVNKGVVLQDGRASNISIVSTESSDLGSPPAEDVIPEIPAKIRSRNGVLDPSMGPDMQYFLAHEPRSSDFGQRSRGGEQDQYAEDLSAYYTNGLESGPASMGAGSRRGRPPVIRAAERLRRQQTNDHYGEGEIMVEYEEYPEDQDNFRITEVNGEQYDVYEDEYDVRYEYEEHSGDEEYVDNQDYPMCQPVQYDSEEYISEGDEYFDREEELRGYNRQIDFTLHTILEESCEDSDVSEPRSGMPSLEQKRSKRHSDPSEMERYFLYGVGGGEFEEEYYDGTSGSASPDEVLEDDLAPLDHHHHQHSHEQPQSLIMLSDQQNTDDSGSVGSESDGQRTPDPKNKKKSLSKSKGSKMSSDNNSEFNSDEDSSAKDSSGSMKRNKKRRGSASDLEVRKHLDQQQQQQQQQQHPQHSKQGSSPSNSLSPKGSPPITPLPREIIEVQPVMNVHEKRASPSTSSAEDPKSISPTNPVIRKHKSRDSGFVGSTDDLLHTNLGQGQASSDSGQSISDGENKNSFLIKRLEKVSEVSGEDDDHHGHGAEAALKKQEILSRKDSFNNWSSDEDTNLMMNRMRTFFRSFLMQANSNAASTTKGSSSKPPQLVAFEAKLTKMMKTVPGINEDQVKELVEYLSSEDTWSDSYDSSDYTSSDIEVYGFNVNNIKNEDLENGEELHKETALMYSKLMAKMQHQEMRSPPIEAKVMAHISSKLVALMHEVNSSSSAEEASSGPTSFDKRRSSANGPPSRRYRPPQPANELSKSTEVLDSRSAALVDSHDRSNSELNVWQGAQRGSQSEASAAHGVHLSSISHPRRGSLGQVSGSSVGSSDMLNDDERWSWKGSFESALAIEAKKKEDELLQQQYVQHHQHVQQQQQSSGKVTSARFKPSMVVEQAVEDKTNKNYSTSSLPRLGTSSIKKQPPPTIETSEATLELSVPKKSNIATTANNPPRSARYRPHGYRPPPTRKNSSPSSRKNSVDSVSKYTGRTTTTTYPPLI